MTASDRYVLRGVLYQLGDFMKLVGLGRDALRKARKNGLRVLRAHGRAYIESDDWFKYLERVSNEESSTNE